MICTVPSDGEDRRPGCHAATPGETGDRLSRLLRSDRTGKKVPALILWSGTATTKPKIMGSNRASEPSPVTGESGDRRMCEHDGGQVSRPDKVRRDGPVSAAPVPRTWPCEPSSGLPRQPASRPVRGFHGQSRSGPMPCLSSLATLSWWWLRSSVRVRVRELPEAIYLTFTAKGSGSRKPVSKLDFMSEEDDQLFGAEHVRVYRETDGERGYQWRGTEILLLSTIGHRSGEERTAR